MTRTHDVDKCHNYYYCQGEHFYLDPLKDLHIKKSDRFRTEDEKQKSALYSARSPVFLRSIKTTLGLCQRGNGCGCTTSVTQERGTLLKSMLILSEERAASCCYL